VRSIILVENKDARVRLDDTRLSLASHPEVNFIRSPEESLLGTISECKDENILLVRAEALDLIDLNKIVVEAKDIGETEVLYLAVESGNEIYRLSQDSPAGLLRAFTNDSFWPLACLAFHKDLLNKCPYSADSVADLIAFVVTNAISKGWSLRAFNQGTISAEDNVNCLIGKPDKNCLAHCLHELIDSSNIEELFPEHAWSIFGAESAAASYHSLAALFIRLSDAEKALQCLALSDGLEDSPRSLALKGLIAQQKGETLAAVANLVSSLQEYEKRKAGKDDAHYVTFQPKDFDFINTRLAAGLEALNVRDNSTALNHFIEAVWNFDSFYEAFGLTSSDSQ